MGTDRYQQTIAQCLCGQGTVDEHFWSDDHPFGDFSWRPDGIRLHCATCERDWVISGGVSNPVDARANQRAIYFVARAEHDEVKAHNATVDAEVNRQWKEHRGRTLIIQEKLRLAQTELLRRVDAVESRLEERFCVLGPIFGFDTVEAFRTAVGRTLPKTYVPTLLRKGELATVLERMERREDAEHVRQAEREIVEISASIEATGRTKKMPRATHQRFAPVA